MSVEFQLSSTAEDRDEVAPKTRGRIEGCTYNSTYSCLTRELDECPALHVGEFLSKKIVTPLLVFQKIIWTTDPERNDPR
jgi:hypothetical protein